MVRLSRWGPVVAWMILIFIVSAQAQLPTPEQRWLDLVLEKSAHAFEFAILAALFLRAMGLEWSERWSIFGKAVLLAWLYALSDEFHQSYVPGRAADWSDVLFDWLGAIAGALFWLWRWIARYYRALSEEA